MNAYHVDLYDTTGAQRAVLTDFKAMSYFKKVNAPGLLQLTLAGDNAILASLGDKWQADVWRKPDGGSWARDFVGMLRMQEWYYSADVGSHAVLTFPGVMSMLSWRHILYYADVADLTLFTAQPGETIMKTLVDYNAAANATTGNGRLRNGAITGLTVEADGAAGSSIDWRCPWENLLENLQNIAKVAGGDFDLVKTSATAWQFRFYSGQLGSDRSATIIFAMERGNMSNPQYRRKWMDEKTVVTAGGRGEGTARLTAIRTGTNYNVSSNNIEHFLSASDAETAAVLNARADAKLYEMQASETFGFDVLQTPGTTYGTHYFLGDLVTAVNPFTGISSTLKVDQVRVTADEMGGERVEVAMVTP